MGVWNGGRYGCLLFWDIVFVGVEWRWVLVFVVLGYSVCMEWRWVWVFVVLIYIVCVCGMEVGMGVCCSGI